MLVDFHIHTKESDGQYSPTDIIQIADRKLLCAISITDHDTISGIEEAENEANKYGIVFIPGIEISSEDECGNEFHILGYGIDYQNVELNRCCLEFAVRRKNRAADICEYLKRKDIYVDLKDINDIADGSVIARPHFAKYLLDRGYVKTRKEAFDLYLDTDDFHKAIKVKKISVEKAIKLINGAGGIAVLAHPAKYNMSDPELRKFLLKAKKEGLNGVECIYSQNSQEETNKFYKLSLELGLFSTCGSDFHGEKVKPNISMGMEIEIKYINEFLNRVISIDEYKRIMEII